MLLAQLAADRDEPELARQSLELAQLGEVDSAFDTLDMAIDQPGWMPRILDLPDLAPLWNHPRLPHP